MSQEKYELDNQKTKASLERSLLTAQDRVKEDALTIEQLRDKVEKLIHQQQN